MGLVPRVAIIATTSLAALLPSASLASAACPTAHPAANLEVFNATSDEQVEATFTKARASEGCNVPLKLPAGFDAMTAQQQMLWLVNNEREVRGLAPYILDSTLMSQIALNHSREMAIYGYANHPSPINHGTELSERESVNPVMANLHPLGSEDIGFGQETVANVVYSFMYEDEGAKWGHREALLSAIMNWIGIGIDLNAAGSAWEDYFTLDFAPNPAPPAVYTPPATADTNPPTMGPVAYSNGTATVTGVADSPLNKNDVAPNATTAGITEVVFYTNSIAESPVGSGSFNTVVATQGTPGTWTAKMTVNAGEVLHAVAVDGSGNFTDSAPPAPAVPLTTGENTVAVPAAPAPPTAAAADREAPEQLLGTSPLTMALAGAAARTRTTPQVRAITPTAAALVRSLDKQLAEAVKFVRVYIDGRWQTYRPGSSHDFPLYAGEGVDVHLRHGGRWKPPTGEVRAYAPTLRLQRGWNFVAAPYPIVHMTCHATRLELARAGDKLEEISVGPTPNTGMIMRPNAKGEWGNDLMMVIDDEKGFWIKDAGTATWTPNPVGYSRARSGIL